jgi:hypothetical protein
MMARPVVRAALIVLFAMTVLVLGTLGPETPVSPALAEQAATPNPTKPPKATATPKPPKPTETPTPVPMGQVSAMATFPDMLLGDVENAAIPGLVPNDHGILLGGVGSDLWHGPGDPPDEFWMVTDRGPRGEGNNGSENQSFAVPEYTPLVLHVRLSGSTVQILETFPIVGQSGQPVTGLPNLASRDNTPLDVAATSPLDYNPSGLDPEGLVRTPNGDLWVVDEYGPSLVHLDPTGKVLKRYVPHGIALDGADYPVAEALPVVFVKRSDGAGFEALTASPDGSTLYLAMQGPLSNPNDDTGDRSRNTRVLAFDVASEQVTGEYVYQFESIRTLDPSKKADPNDIKISAMAMCDDGQLLVLERTGRVARLYMADMTEATNIAGTVWDELTMRPSLEAVNDLPPDGIFPLAKTLAIDLTDLPKVPDKLEGLAILDPSTIVVANDNDFDIGKFDKDGLNDGDGDKSRLVTVSLFQPMP